MALEHVAERQPDVIVLDLMMPELNGFEFLTALRRNPAWRNISIVVLTAKDLTPDDHRALNGAVARVLQKGAYDRDQLLGEVRRTLATAVGRRGVRPASAGS